jgi:hypothetical protein
MVDHHSFTAQFLNLCHAFRKTIDMESMWQYYKAFEVLTEPEVKQLFSWAIDNIDKSFPTIAVLNQYATAQGWFARTPSRRDELVPVFCGECGGSFVVRRSQLEQDAQAGRIYRCINYDWKCPVIFYARTILEKEHL